MLRLEGKVAVVSGGTSGIGLAIARRFAKEGAQVFIFGRRLTRLADLDRVADAVRSATDKVDVVVSNAALFHSFMTGSDMLVDGGVSNV